MNKHAKILSASILALSVTPALAFEAKVSGQLNIGALMIDDGDKTESYIVDNSNSSSRFRFTGSGEVADGLTAGIRYEMEFESNASAKTGTGTDYDSGDTDKNKLTERYAEIYLKGNFGQVHLGQGDAAANGITHIDLSGTNVAALLGDYGLIGGSTLFLDDGVAGPSVIGAIRNADFESRYDRLAYFSPKVGPLSLGVSAGRKNSTHGVYEVAAEYASNFDFGKVAGGVGYSSADEENQSDHRETIGGSFSILLNSGINGAVSYSNRKAGNDFESDNLSFRLGYKWDHHATSVDYGVTEDRAMEGDEANVISLNYVYKPVGWAEFYATARQFSLDRSGADFDEVNAYLLGSRIKF